MPRTIEIRLTCDWDGCTVTAPEGEGSVVEKTVALDARKPRMFLICTDHLEELEGILLPLLQRGQTVGGAANGTAVASTPSSSTSSSSSSTRKPPVAYQCEHEIEPGRICGRTIRGKVGMAQHVGRTHGYESLATYEQLHGLTPLDL